MSIKQKQLPIKDATDDQIYNFTDVMGLEPGATRAREAVLGLLETAWPHNYILVPDEDTIPNYEEQRQAARPVSQPMGLDTEVGASDPQVELTIGSTEMPGGKDMVPLQCNGRSLIVPRNRAVTIPYRFYLALLDAKRAEVSQDPNTREITETTITNYPVSVTTLPSAHEIADWHARVDSIELGSQGLASAA